MRSLIVAAVYYVFKFIEFAILARVLISWLPIPKDNQFIRLLYQLTEPILAPIRGIMEKSAIGGNMMLDFSPVVAFILIAVVENILLRIL